MDEEDYCYCHYHNDTYEYFDCLDYMECEECPYYYADEDQVIDMERLTKLKYYITKLDAKIKNLQERIEKMAFDDKAEVGVKFLASTVSDLKELREYKQLEEQGLLLRLPCKVGDTVYHVVQGRIVEVSNVDLFFLLLSVAENRFNNSVFLTQAEAEQKLKELKEMKTHNGITE